MTCVAVTRGGIGDFWLFESRDEADEHPLVQYGDTICSSPADVLDQHNAMELNALAGRLGLSGAERLLQEHIWDLMVLAARPVPQDADDVCRIIVADRRLTRRRTMAAAEKVTPKAKTIAGYGMKSVITLGQSKMKDKDGKETGELVKLGPKNNPKRAGTASATRFALYKDGMTIEKAIAAGITASDISHDQKAGLIAVQAVV